MEKHMRSRLILLFTVNLFIHHAAGQSFDWRTGFHGFFDNREYFNQYIDDQTMFGSRVYAEAGFSLNDDNHFMAGISYLYEFGSKGDLIAPDIILYYHTGKGPLEFYLGAFPRKGLINQPLMLLTDTLNYYRPNAEGMFLEFSKPWGYHNIWIDWTGRQTDTRRETFLLGGAGHFRKGVLFCEHHFIMYHFAAPAIPIPGDHLRDNGGLTAVCGLNLSGILPVDSLFISSGIGLSVDRIRNVYDFRTPVGWYTELGIEHKGFGMHGTCYLGDSHTIIYGDKFYTSDSYQRIDLYYTRSRSARIRGRLQFSFHFIPGVVDYSQMLVVLINLEGSRQINKAL
jgi:hypothetical protein